MRLFLKLAPVYLLVLCGTIAMTHWGSRAVTTMVESAPLENRWCIIVDAGHGGVDGGATSCSGVLESQINLQIAMRLDDLLHLLGHETKMIRKEDISVYTEGNTIAAKKVSDLKQRVNLVNETPRAVLISIHQNYYTDSRYDGAQVFYGEGKGSVELAKELQSGFRVTGSKRTCKRAEGVYLMDHIQCLGVLVECGFISNPMEDQKLQNPNYQKMICCVIASCVNTFLNT